MLAPGGLIGLPEPLDPVGHLAWARYLLVSMSVLWAASVARTRRSGALLAGLAFFGTAVGFWLLTFGRPYGLFVDPDATRRAAEVAVVATAGGPEGVLAAGPAASWTWALAGRSGLPRPFLLLVPTLLPLLLVPAVSVLLLTLWTDRTRAPVAALLWLAFSTGDLDALEGGGVVNGAWSHPEQALLFLPVVAAALLVGRWAGNTRAGAVLAGLPVAAFLAAPAAETAMLPAEVVLRLTVAQGLWLPLGVVGLVRSCDAATRALVMGGLLAAVVSAAGAPLEFWGGHASFRLGLLLAASGPVLEAAARAGEWLSRASARLAGPSSQVGLAAVLVAVLPGSFLAWWDPLRGDPVAAASVDPLSPVVRRAADWIRRETPPESVFVASSEYAAHVAVLGGRRLLRAPGLLAPSDDTARRRAERLVLSGRDAEPLGSRYRLTHVFVAPGDFRDRGIARPEDLDSNPCLRLRYADEEGLRVYEIVRRVPSWVE